jgi:hypothetical protein
MKLVFLAVAFAFAAHPLLASEESHKAAIEKLFVTMKMKEQYETSLLTGFNAGASMSDQKLIDLPLEQQNKVNAAMERVRIRVLELMGWDSVKEDMTKIYMKNFKEEEVVAITEMLATPTGQMLLSKQIQLLPTAMAVGQKKAQAVMPEILQIMQESFQ